MAREKKKKGGDAPGAPAWMVTFSDMVTLLLCFFVLLLSMANMDQVKFLKVANSMRSAFGVVGDRDALDLSPAIIETGVTNEDLVQRVYKRIESQLNRLTLNKDVELVKDRGAVVLRINSAVLFDVGESSLKPQAFPVLKRVAELVRPLPLHLRVEGHTDDSVFAGRSISNWDISMFRSIAVVKFFAENQLLPLDRMSAAGYGDQHPVAPNDTPENRALNRRVEFVLESIGGYTKELPYLIDARDQLPF